MRKSIGKIPADKPKPVGKKQDNPTLPPVHKRPIQVRGIKDAKRLLSRLITELQQGSVDGRAAKDLTYLLNSFVTITRDTEIEARLAELEKRLDESKKVQK